MEGNFELNAIGISRKRARAKCSERSDAEKASKTDIHDSEDLDRDSRTPPSGFCEP